MNAPSSLIAAATVLSAVVPATAHAADVPVSRQSAPAGDTAKLQASSPLFFLAAIVGVAIGIFLLIDDDDEESVSA